MNEIKEWKVAELIVRMMEERGIEADESCTAAGGKDYGCIEAWETIGGKYAVKFGDNGKTDYELTDDVSDLPCWLMEDGDAHGDLAEIANARDEDPEEVEEDYVGEVSIVLHADMYAPGGRYAWVCEENRDTPRTWVSRAEAQEWIDEQESEVYVTQHNEAGRPDYYIVKAAR